MTSLSTIVSRVALDLVPGFRSPCFMSSIEIPLPTTPTVVILGLVPRTHRAARSCREESRRLLKRSANIELLKMLHYGSWAQGPG